MDTTTKDPRPRVRGDVNEHYWLAQRMAKATGVDVAGAFSDGALDSEEWADLITRCQTCRWTEGCKRFLDRTSDDTPSIPHTCENHALLERLAARQDT